MLLLLCRLSILILLLASSAFSAEQQDNRARLQQIQERIKQTSKSLKKQQNQELSLLRDLAVINTSLKETDRRIAKLKKEQKRGEKKILNVRGDIAQGRRDLQQQERKLKKRLISLYKEGNTGVLKVLFSSNSPMELAEQYEYLSRILDNDKNMMSDFRGVIKQQKDRLAQLENLQKQKQQHLSAEKSERADARLARQLQAKLLSKVRRDKSQIHAELQNLKANARRLKDLVSSFGRQKDIGHGNFTTRKGRLPWPLKGALLVGFGTQKNSGLGTLYESHGIEIAASKGMKIKAVATGKVVFSSWFKGYGNLLIVSHEGGYHTLYAKADKLLKQIGERVEMGEPVALAGLSGEQGIYFEVRQMGAPVDPLSWLIRR